MCIKRLIFSIAIMLITGFMFINIENNTIIDITSNIKRENNVSYYVDVVIEVPKINLKQRVIKAKDNFSNLNHDLVYYDSFNANDKIVIFGHSGNGLFTYFRRLEELKVLDEVFIYNGYYRYLYEVYEAKTISKYDIYILNKEPDSKKLYLVTCSKNDENTRILIKLVQKSVKTLKN